MNRKRTSIIAFIGLAVVGLIIYCLRPTSAPISQSPKSPVEPSENVASFNKVISTPANPEPVNLDKPAAVENQPDTNQRKAYLTAFLTPISFWGKVVDEKGNPVPGATVKLGVNNNPDPMGGAATDDRTTDANGLFSITGAHGIALNVEVSKEGYYSTDKSRGTANYVLTNNTDLPVPTADAPAVFVLRKMGETVPLIRVKRQQVPVPKNGSPVDVNLETGAAGQGGIRVECWTEDQSKNAQGRYNWRCRISVPGGGLAERTDQYGFEAPPNGYQPSNEIAMSQTAEKWNKGTSKEYFAKLPGGNYARFSFRLTTGGQHFFVMESYVNPTPENRSLEYDPNQAATSNY